MSYLHALVLAVAVIGCSASSKTAGAPAPQPQAGAAPRVDCQKFLRHLVAIGGVTARDMPAEEANLLRDDVEQFYASRCADREYLAYLDGLPKEHMECLMRARRQPEVEACIAKHVDKQMAAQETKEAAAAAAEKEIACAPPVAAGGTATLVGNVRNGAREELAGVTIVVKTRDEAAQVTLTDENGRYEFRSLPPGHYKVVAYYGEQTIAKTCVAAPGGTTTVDVAIPGA
jgi:hypothetical protein